RLPRSSPGRGPAAHTSAQKNYVCACGLMKEFAFVWGVNAKGPCIHIVGKQIFLRFLDAGYDRQRRKIVPFGRMVAKIVRTMAAGLVPHFINAVKKQVL